MSNVPSGNSTGYSVLSEALRGIVSAQYQLALILEEENDIELASAWYKKAALQGHVDAAFRAGMLALTNKRAENHSDAVYWLQRAAVAGHIGASYNMALVYESGRGVQFDPEESLRWHRIAARRGHPAAKAKLEDLDNWFGTSNIGS